MFKSIMPSLKVGLLAAAVLLMTAGESHAQRGRGFGGRWGGGWGSYGWGGYGGYGWGYPRYGGYGWGYPSYGYYGGYSYPYYGNYAYSVPYYADTWVPYQDYSSYATPATATYQSFYPQDQQANSNTATVMVKVPTQDAQVFFDGQATNQRGMNRNFTTPALTPGKTYGYEVRATWTGPLDAPVTQTRTIQVTPGQRTIVDFTQPQQQQSEQPRQ
jgi:uncharacterized protein (TIGR03000 family)